MSTIMITLPEDCLVKLKEMAARLGVTSEEFARISLEELLRRPEEALQRAITYVLTKNAELYRRLASCTISSSPKSWNSTARLSSCSDPQDLDHELTTIQ